MDDKEHVRYLLGKQANLYAPLMFNWSDHQRLRDAYFSLRYDFLSHKVFKDPFGNLYDFTTSKAVHVHHIVYAMKSTRNAIDAFKQPVIEGRPAEMGPATAFILAMSDLEIQLVAWDVLFRVYCACRGIHVMQSYGSWELTSEAERHSFESHLRHLLWLLRKSKMICYQMCERATWLDRLAMRPMAELARFNSMMAHEKGPQECRHQCAGWQQALGIRPNPNRSERRLGKMSSKDIKQAMPEIFKKRRRSIKRELSENDLAIDSASKKRRLRSWAWSEGRALKQIGENVVNSKSMKQTFQRSAPVSADSTCMSVRVVPKSEEMDQKIIGHEAPSYSTTWKLVSE